MRAGYVFLLGRPKSTGAFPMQKKLAIVVSAVITLALPQFALAHTSNGQSPASMNAPGAGFVHGWSTGSAGPEPIQSIDAKKIPGAPNGMLAEMADLRHDQSMCRTPADGDFAALPTCP